MLFFVTVLLLANATTSMNLTPINIDLCKQNQWTVRHFIVYNCSQKRNKSGKITRRDLKPIACDPADGLTILRKNRPLFPGQEYKDTDGFVYECMRSSDGTLTYQAKECYMDHERFLPGHYMKGKNNNVFLCYRELDKVLRIRVFRPVHNKCDPQKKDDPDCYLGVIQTILNSKFGTASHYAYNLETQHPIITSPKRSRPATEQKAVFDLRSERPSLDTDDLLKSIQGLYGPNEFDRAETNTKVETLIHHNHPKEH